MTKSFVAQVSSIVLKHKELVDGIARESIQELVKEANKPKAKGGRMPVDTGFLRASGQMSLTGMPTGPVRGDPEKKYRAPEAYAVLDGVTAGMTVFFGWTAIYARKQNLYNGFLDGALMNWQKIVNKVVRKLAKRV